MPKTNLKFDGFSDLVRSRRTVHDFTNDIPPNHLILEAIEQARWAPNHHRTEPWYFRFPSRAQIEQICQLNAELIRQQKGPTAGPEKAEKIAAVKLRRWLAMPGWLVLTCQRDDDPLRQQEDYAACCCAAQNMMLLLWEKGIGVKWTTGNITRERDFFDIIEAEFASEFVVGLFWYGYPAEIIEQHRKPLADIVTVAEASD